MAGRTFAGRIISVDDLTGDASLLTFSCPTGTAGQARAGQFVQVLCRDPWSYDPYLRQSSLLFGASARDETLSIAVSFSDRRSRWLASRRPGDEIEVSGPSGKGFTIGPATRNLLLVAADRPPSALVMLASEAVERGLNVTFLMGAANDTELLSPICLPSGVEIVSATRDGSRGHVGEVSDLIPTYARWADQVFSHGSDHFQRELKLVLQPLRIAGKPSLQIAVERDMPCGFAVCNGCTVATRGRTVLACARGPVFDADEFV